MAKIDQTNQMQSMVTQSMVTIIREPIAILTVGAFLLSIMMVAILNDFYKLTPAGRNGISGPTASTYEVQVE